MYIPAMLVTHDGHALDDKTIFRKSETVLQENTKKLLGQLGITSKAVVMALGLEQEFFAIPKKAYQNRPDLVWTGRTLVGDVAPKNQQLSDHYYGKIPKKVEEAFQ